MSTASVANVSRTRSNFQNKNANHDGNSSGLARAQCMPMPLPALGSPKILHGNGTNVGTVISLLCPDKHKLVGKNIECVTDSNSTHWEGETYCKPLSYNEAYGFRLAVLVSIVSTAVIFLMSMAFLTCCLVDCIENSKRKKLDRDSRRWEGQDHQQESHRPQDSNKSRNNNNNNIMEKDVTQQNQQDPLLGDNSQTCRCLQQYGYAVSPPLLPPLPEHEYNQPLLPPNPKSAQYSCQPPYNKPSRQTLSSNLIQVPATGPGLVWQYGGAQQSSLPGDTNQSNRRNINSAKECSIRIISV